MRNIKMFTNEDRIGISEIGLEEFEAISQSIGGGWNICAFVLESALAQSVLGNCIEAYAETTGLSAVGTAVGVTLGALTNIAFDAVMNAGNAAAESDERGWDLIIGESGIKTIEQIVANIQSNVYGAF
jgi:hypothetical protein